MSTTRRFLFETSFDDGFRPFEAMPAPPPPPPKPEPEPVEELPPPEPTFSQADLLQAHEDGYGDGFAAGKAAAEAAAASRTAASLAAIEAVLARLVVPLEAQTAERREAAVQIGLAIARKLLPQVARRHALAEIEAMIATTAAEMIDEPRLVVRVADEMLEEVAARMDALTTARGFQGRVVLLADPALGYGDCRIEWAEGGVERSGERIWRDIDRAASRLPQAAGSSDPASPAMPGCGAEAADPAPRAARTAEPAPADSAEEALAAP
ncbi:FliH/SctL family protein [Arenibaculum pallidiluteum]|uniref:FliH/SctL family protein n=1 Tax=Arenibaculum pallidiluteum TaxID=2812559 RepID=UPI001A968650|nr:FliH/SctL family protein [Arenibaculum pallidiluteum]